MESTFLTGSCSDLTPNTDTQAPAEAILKSRCEGKRMSFCLNSRICSVSSGCRGVNVQSPGEYVLLQNRREIKTVSETENFSSPLLGSLFGGLQIKLRLTD